MDPKEMAAAVKEEKQRLRDECPFKKGDVLSFGDKFGTFDHVYINDEMRVWAVIKLPVTSYIGWSSATAQADIAECTKIENPCSREKLARAEDVEYRINNEIKELTKRLSRHKAKVQRIIAKEKNGCAHDWHKGDAIRTEKDWINGEVEIYDCCCNHCGMEVESR
jgi:hypothetical protein